MKYLFDTNVLLRNPALIRDYRHDVVVSPTVLSELDYRKKIPEHQENAQLSIKHINQYNIYVLKKPHYKKDCNNDGKIINEAKESSQNDPIVIVSDDEGLQVFARSAGVSCISLTSFQKEMMQSSDIPTEDDQNLFNLVKNGRLDEANIFLQTHSVNPNFTTADNLTPLIHFIRKKQFNQTKFWISLPQCDLNHYDHSKFPMPPYAHAAQRGWLKGVQYLLENGANPHLLSDGKNKGNSALLIAVWDGRFDIVQYLLESKTFQISINQADGNGFTPLMKAAIKGHTLIAEYLLKQSTIDLLIRDRDGKSALDHAQVNGNHEISKLIKEQS
ncbi:ankyrin repeat domain-containing protein [Methanogenium sp. MK-MG]|uniref:ankyrin repeat domain-containing protein n=1 Tax=Methanogenium sp. MK-MG TaxID=2599926 RepID=UPI0013EC4078|nr:ankyrin repeat domain-containing protein [Methanogenium sp. MK-MG]KAF1078126.1 hypothetical protein MKMG_00932 [Methanogenium sp. MK-MG]